MARNGGAVDRPASELQPASCASTASSLVLALPDALPPFIWPKPGHAFAPGIDFRRAPGEGTSGHANGQVMAELTLWPDRIVQALRS